MVSAPLVADYIIGSSETPLTPMQVNKLAYISHGFTLALEDEPLFHDKVEAWKYGPVIPPIYYMLRHYKRNTITALSFCGTKLTNSDKEKRMEFIRGKIPDPHKKVIGAVLKEFGHFNGLELSTITHEPGTPWDTHYKRNKLGVEIPNDMTKKFYKSELRR